MLLIVLYVCCTYVAYPCEVGSENSGLFEEVGQKKKSELFYNPQFYQSEKNLFYIGEFKTLVPCLHGPWVSKP